MMTNEKDPEAFAIGDLAKALFDPPPIPQPFQAAVLRAIEEHENQLVKPSQIFAWLDDALRPYRDKRPLNPGQFYDCLETLERRGFIEGTEVPAGAPARHKTYRRYALTPKGHQALTIAGLIYSKPTTDRPTSPAAAPQAVEPASLPSQIEPPIFMTQHDH